MVESSAAALKSFLLSVKTPLLWTYFGEMEGGHWEFFCRSFQKLQSTGPLSNPLGLLDGSAVPTKTIFFLCGLSNLLNQAGIADFASPGISKKPAALNCLLLFVTGELLGSPLRHPLAFHASWYYRLFIQLLFKLDADRVALDMCIAKKKKKKGKKRNANDGHFKYFYLSKHPLSWGCQKKVDDLLHKWCFFFFPFFFV